MRVITASAWRWLSSVAPAQAFDGSTIEVRYTVTNLGANTTAALDATGRKQAIDHTTDSNWFHFQIPGQLSLV